MWWDFLFWASPLPNSYFLLAFQNDTLFWLYQLSIQTHTVFIIKISPTCIYRVNNLEDVDHFCLYVSTVWGCSCCVPLITDCALHWALNAQIWNLVCEKYGSPKFEEIPRRDTDANFNEKEIWFHSETNPCDSFPEFEELSEPPLTLRAFLGTLWWTWVIFFGCRQESMHMGGIISGFPQVWCPRSDSIWPLLFSHPLSGGHRTRLRIRYKSK